MDLEELKMKYYFFESNEFGRVYVFVDFSNVRHWAKDFWPEENKYRLCTEIDIEKLANLCNLVDPKRKFFYYGYFPRRDDLDSGHELNIKYGKSIFRINKARKSGFVTRTKEIKMIPHYDEDGRFLNKIPKCNFDVEICMDMLMKTEKYDSVMLFSGDSDFGGLLGYLKSKNKKIVVVCARNRMSTELENVADRFIPAETLKDLLKYENKNTPPKRAEG